MARSILPQTAISSVCAPATPARQNGSIFPNRSGLRELCDFIVRRQTLGSAGGNFKARMFDDGFAQGDVTGQCNYGKRRAARSRFAWQFPNAVASCRGGKNSAITVVAACANKIFRMRL